MQPWSFVHVNDIQIGSPRSFRWQPAWEENWNDATALIRKIKPDLMVCGGDLTRDGYILSHTYELTDMKARFDALGIPWRTIPGNMDVGNKVTRIQGPYERDDLEISMIREKLQHFASVFGDLAWTFVHKNVRFTGFYGALAGSDLPQEADMWRLLESLSSLPKAQYHVATMHYALFVDEIGEPNFDITRKESYHDWYFCIDHPYRDRMLDLFKTGGVDIVISGHIHCRRPPQCVDGIRFLKSAATCFPQWADRWDDGDATLGFFRFDVNDERIEETFVPLQHVSTIKGYGPGGHPRLEERDYSLAWEK